MKQNKELIFVVDPMCSWCWGFTPVIEKMQRDHADAYTFSLVVGGLRTKGQMTWDATSKNYLKNHWKSVQEYTDVTFNYDLFEKQEFDYDTYPACKAIVTMRELYGMGKSFELLHQLHSAFYVSSEDITDRDVILVHIKKMGVEEEAFMRFYGSERAEMLMQHDFAKARSMGANAFPSVVIIDEDGHMICEKGYRSYDELLRRIG